MPTRYALDLEALKGSVTVETLKEPFVPPPSLPLPCPPLFPSPHRRRRPFRRSLPSSQSAMLHLTGQTRADFSGSPFSHSSQREDAKKAIKASLEERYQTGKNRWFFESLRF